MNTVKPYITKIFLFPMSNKHFLFEDNIMKEFIIITMIDLQIYIKNVLNMDTQPDTKNTKTDSLDIEIVSSEIIYMNQLLT